MRLIDTHSHIHDKEFFSSNEAEKVILNSTQSGVDKIICIGTTLEDSRAAIEFASKHPDHVRASVGIHPHEAAKLSSDEIKIHLQELGELAGHEMVVAVGECGFDFFYNNKKDSQERQSQLLSGQLEIGMKHKLPMSFHVRDAFDEFWEVYEAHSKERPVPGVLHSFSDSEHNAKRAIEHGLFIGVNGIATFTKNDWQQELFKNLPIDKVILETDAPFLTPVPKRGTINEPRNVIYITRFMAELRGETEKFIAQATTANALKLFNFS